jgi:hypothetical protein
MVVAGVAAGLLLVAGCAPAAGRTRSSSELGLRTARQAAATTLAPAPAPDPLVPVTTTTPATTPPVPAGSFITPGERLAVGGCPLFPRDNVFHASIRALARRADSDRMIAAAGGSSLSVTSFGSVIWEGSRPGLPVNILDARTSQHRDLLPSLAYQAVSEPDGVPWPDEPMFEGFPGRAWDKHLLVVDSSTCHSWEMINVQPPWENIFGALFNKWYVDKVVSLDLRTNQPNPKGTVNASGFSLMAGQIRYDEVASGAVSHAVGVSLPVIRQGPPTWPAVGSDGTSTDPQAPPMGSWLRLKATTDLRGLGPQAAVVARALQEHGAIVSDSGPRLALATESDARWNDADLAALERFTLGDFEVVDPSPMKVSDSSFQIR